MDSGAGQAPSPYPRVAGPFLSLMSCLKGSTVLGTLEFVDTLTGPDVSYCSPLSTAWGF